MKDGKLHFEKPKIEMDTDAPEELTIEEIFKTIMLPEGHADTRFMSFSFGYDQRKSLTGIVASILVSVLKLFLLFRFIPISIAVYVY